MTFMMIALDALWCLMVVFVALAVVWGSLDGIRQEVSDLRQSVERVETLLRREAEDAGEDADSR